MKRIFALLFLLYSLAIYAQPGAIDLNFNVTDAGFGIGDGFNADVVDMAVQANGKIVVVGAFSSCNSYAKYGVARINTDGSIDTTFKVALNDIGQIVTIRTVSIQADGKIIIGGTFTNINGYVLNNIARLNIDGSLDFSFNTGTGFDGEVIASAIQADGKIILGGIFTNFNGVSTSKIARLNTDGTLDFFDIGTGFEYFDPIAGIYDIAIQTDGKIIVGGEFDIFNGNLKQNIARLNSDGSIDNTFIAAVGYNLISIVIQADGKILIGGRFTTVNGIPKKGLARLNPDGSIDSSFNQGTGIASGSVISIALQIDNKIIVGGQLGMYNDTIVKNIVRLHPNGNIDTSFHAAATGENIYEAVEKILILNNNNIIITGNFTSFNNTIKNSIVSVGNNGNVNNSFGLQSGFNSTINSLSIQSDNKIIAGGNFTLFNNKNVNYLTRLTQNGIIDTTFNTGTGFNNSVFETILQTNGKIIVGGNFTSYNGINTNRIVRLNTNGTLDATFIIGTGFDNIIHSIVLQSDGKIIVAGNFTSYNGTSINRIIRLNSDGSIDGSFNPGIGADDEIYSVKLLDDGKIIIGGTFYSYSGSLRAGSARLNTDGSLDMSFAPVAELLCYATAIQNDGKVIVGGSQIYRLNNDGSTDLSFDAGLAFEEPPTSPSNYDLYAIEVLENGKIIIGGSFNYFNGSSVGKITRLNSNGSLDTSIDFGSGFDSTVYVFAKQSDDKLIVGGDFLSFNNTGKNRITRLITSYGQLYVSGKIFVDNNENCIQDGSEVFLNRQRLIINPGNIIAETNNTGEWYAGYLPAGNYTITIDSTYNWIPSCTTINSFTITNPDSITATGKIGLINNTLVCSRPEVTINAPFLRRCFNDQKVYVKVCNAYFANVINSAYVIVKLNPLLIPTSALLTYTSLGNDEYRFNIGNLNPDNCFSFYINCTVSCDALNLQTLCMEAKLYPADACVFDTITTPFPIGNVIPCNLPWDNSSLKVSGFCQNDSIIFTVTNSGSGNMGCYAPVRIYIDGILTQLDSVLLTAGQITTYTFAADGRTWRLEADQHPLHPGNSHPNATIEACGNLSNWTPDLVNILPQDDADAVKDIYCGLVTGSYDPNDKTGFPLGVGTSHNVLPNGDLEYLIRFQNTGTDTAFTVVIRDTLSPNLDIFSIRSGVSSHNYSFRLYGQRIAEWTFNNILLPDSTTNQAASNGFVKFRIKQNRNLPDGTQIKNSADIYFDYNAPVITNQTLHTIDRMLVQPNWNGERTITTNACTSYTFNYVDYTNSGTYFQRVTTATTDSLITINLTIKNNSSNTINPVACASYTAPDGAVYTTSGTKTAIIPNVAGCDSTITINLTIKNNSSSTINPTACTSYTAPDGAVYTTSGTKTAIIPNAAGCDSIITINLTINDLPDANVTQNDIELNATLAGANYQWIDCSNGNTAISTQTAQNFTATTNGDYAVIITQNGCSSTSDCYTISTVGLIESENKNNNSIQIFPNPSNGFVTIANDNNFLNATIKFTTIEGALVYQKENVNVSSLSIDLNTIAIGIYFIQIIEQNRISNYKLIKN